MGYFPDANTRQRAIEAALPLGAQLDFVELVTAVSRESGSPSRLPDGYVRWDIRQARLRRRSGAPALVVLLDPVSGEYLYERTSDPDRIAAWLEGRESDSGSRVATMLAVAGAGVELTTPGSPAYQRAYLEQLHLGRLKQDLEQLERALGR